jgi:hypothetical protein
MTIALSANTPRISYAVSQGATQTSFAVPFVFFTGSTDLNVFVDNTERTFDASTSNTTLYTVSGGDGSTGTVTTSVTGATGGSTVVITRAVPLSRTTDFPSSGAFEISKLNTELDTITAIQSDFNDSANRAIRLQDSDDAVSLELPLKSARLGTVLGFNATTGAAEAGPTITAVQSLADVTASINLLGTSAVVTDMGLLATSANITAMGILGTSANVTAMGLLGTSDVVADMALLGTSDVVADMALLATTDVIADMAQLANTTIIDDLAQLANTTITDDMAILATSDNVTAMGVLGTSANVTAMGLLGTSAVVEDMGFLGTSANVTAMGLLGTSANVTAMGLLGTSAVVTDMSLLGTSAVVTDMDILATSANVTNMATLGASGVVGNIATVAGISSNVTTVANNVSGVNSFAERYRVASSAPSSSLDVGDLYFDTTANELKVYKSSGWAAAGSTVNGTSERFTYNITGTPTTLTGASGTGFAEANGNTLAYDAGFLDVYLNGVKMVNGTDVTVTSGTSVVFASALSNGDVVDIVTFGTFNVATLNASNLASGTVPVARVSGSYTSITGTGALDAGSITSGFGNIDVGSSTITTTGAISGGSLTANGGVTVDNITIDGSEIDLSSGDLTLDVAGNINLDADGGTISLQDAGTEVGRLILSSNGGDVILSSRVSDKDVVFSGNDGGSITEFMRIDSSEGGRVGIGTASPDGELHIEPTAGGTNASLILSNDGRTQYYRVQNNETSDALTFNANDTTQIMQITGVNVGIFSTAQTARLNIESNVSAYTHISLKNNNSSNTSGIFQNFLNASGTVVGSISQSGTSTSFNTSSDYRLKENVTYDFDATTRLKQLKPCRFNFIEDDDNTTQDGFLAHEVSNVVPSSVNGVKDGTLDIGIIKDKDGKVLHEKAPQERADTENNETWTKTGTENVYQGIDQSKLVPLLVKTIQELEARITALESA